MIAVLILAALTLGLPADGGSAQSDRAGSPTIAIDAPLEVVSGTATWYCGNGSPCTRGYAPGELVAAIDRKDSSFRKGHRVLVTSGSRSVTVTIVDVCGCPGRRVIDLSAEAFSRLAPLGRGVIPVTIQSADAPPTLPPTDVAP